MFRQNFSRPFPLAPRPFFDPVLGCVIGGGESSPTRNAALNRRSTLVYITMLAVFAGGMWMILSYGSSHLSAPIDLAGEWELSPLTGTAGDTQHLRIDQSGKFFTITSPAGTSIHMRLIEQQGQTLVRVSGADGQITLQSTDGQSWRFTAVGKLQGDWTATLASRGYRQNSIPTTAHAR